jgi:hypothetical protein
MFAKIMAFLKDAHMLVAVLMLAATTTYHFSTHMDLGPQYVNSLYAAYAFLGGHSFVNRDKKEPPQEQ